MWYPAVRGAKSAVDDSDAMSMPGPRSLIAGAESGHGAQLRRRHGVGHRKRGRIVGEGKNQASGQLRRTAREDGNRQPAT